MYVCISGKTEVTKKKTHLEKKNEKFFYKDDVVTCCRDPWERPSEMKGAWPGVALWAWHSAAVVP
jgi:hypothetical protein